MCTENKKKAVLMVIVGIILLGTMELFARPCSDAPPGLPGQGMCCTTFTGKASGGTLIMWDNLGRNARYVAVETIAGESAKTAIERLANAIDNTDPFLWEIPTGQKFVTSLNGELRGIVGGCGDYMTAGTETGLGIPQPPHSLTANYDPNLKKITLKWINPSPDIYDSIRVRFHWSDYGHSGGDAPAGNAESYVIDLGKHPVDTGDLDVLVIGIRNDISSNAAAIHINNNIQEELYGIPFTAGIAPNWQSWSLVDTNGGKISPQMGIKSQLARIKGRPYNPIKRPQDKPFYQIINTGDKGGTGGVFRKFIGLTPGNTYRLSARLSTLETDPNDKGWSYSLHAIADKPGVEKLTENQMAGLAALPDGKKGLDAGRLKVLDSTNRKYEECSSDITLPEDSNSITVWLRLTGKNTIAVGFDWIKLEDLGVK